MYQVLAAACGLSRCEFKDSPVVAHGLNCPLACGILVPRPDIEPMSPALEAWTLNHWTTREVTMVYFRVHSSVVHPVGFDECCVTQNDSFTALNILCLPFSHLTSLPSPTPTNPDLFTVSTALPAPEGYVVGVIRCVNLADWLLSLSSVLLRFLSVFSCLDRSFLF